LLCGSLFILSQREEGQTTQWPNEKDKQRSNASHKIAKIVQQEGH
jgi:hypothetical protein